MVFEVSVADAGDGARLARVSGEVDLETAPELSRRLRQVVREGRDLVVDLSAVGYIDSSGIAVLVQVLKAAQQAGRRLVLQNPSKRVVAVMQLAQLHRVFDIRDDDGPAP